MYKENIILYFLRKDISHFLSKEKVSCFREKDTIFPESLMKISYFRAFFWERSSFIYCLRCKIIFSRKRNMIFPNYTRKIIFQQGFFQKIISSGPLEKENMVFRAVVTMKKYKCAYGIIRCFLHRLCLLHTFNGLVIVRVKFDKKHFQ